VDAPNNLAECSAGTRRIHEEEDGKQTVLLLLL